MTDHSQPTTHLFSTRPSTLGVCLGVIASLLLSQGLGGAESTEVESQDIPHYIELIEYLKNFEGVIPATPEYHPVAGMYNREAVVPPQCYTRTDIRYNPCYVCHQDHIRGRENRMGDRDLQEAYSFSDLGMTNHWKNLFEDRTAKVETISDAEILEYIDQDNYSELAGRLQEAEFEGWIPDLKDLHLGAAAFDDEGFAKDGSHWVAFNYKPFPSTFWPTNGSTDDVMIRLTELYRSDREGAYSKDVYKANLAITEAKIKGVPSIGSLPIDEKRVGVDLDGDGKLGLAVKVDGTKGFVGKAEGLFHERGLYPEGTEFLHTVRYVGVDDAGEISVSKRMKEVRYMRKVRSYSKFMYGRKYQTEGFEKEAGNLPGYINLGPHGLDNGTGWAIQGFIENRRGRLRALTYEENFSCMGCHNSIGATIDKTFSFPRKVDGAAGWTYINLKGMPDAPSAGEERGEIGTYLERVGGGSEFRHNEEMAQRWYRPDGTADREKIAQARDVYELITPSRERALRLNKAYRAIVEDQDFIYGKDVSVVPPKNVYDRIDNETSPTLPEEFTYDWNILLDWESGEGSGG